MDSNISNKINQLNEKVWASRNSMPADIISLSKDNHALAIQHDYEQGIAQYLLIQSYQDFRLSNFKESLALAKEALSIFEKYDDGHWLQRNLNTLGIIYGQTGDFKNAQRTILQSYKLAKKLGQTKPEADALTNLAIIYVHFGEYDTALEHNLESLKLYQGLEDTQNEVKILQNIGVIFFDLGRYSDALEQFQKAEKLLFDSDDDYTYALVCSNLGRTYHKLNKSLEAHNYQKKSLELYEQSGNISGLSYLYDEIGRRHLDNTDFKEAEYYLQQSLILKEDLEDQKGKIDTNLHLGTLYRLQNRFTEAIDVVNTALSLAIDIEAKKEQADAYCGLSKINADQGLFEQAYDNLQKHLILKNKLFGVNSDQRFQALRVKNDVEQTEKEKEIFRLKNIELVQLNEQLQTLSDKLEKQAIEDPLTKLFNRRHFETVLQKVYLESIRYQKDMSVLICDIDNFKNVNDTFSHAVGDQVLMAVANIFRNNMRETDTIARYGGEEFVIVFPETNANKAAESSDRLRQLIANYPWDTIHADLKVTISMGICEEKSLGSGEAMISQADVALYKVKRNGKNHIRIWQKEESVIWSSELSELAV